MVTSNLIFASTCCVSGVVSSVSASSKLLERTAGADAVSCDSAVDSVGAVDAVETAGSAGVASDAETAGAAVATGSVGI